MTTEWSTRIPEFTQGDRLRKARELTGHGVREFADVISVSHQTVTNAEKGHRAVRPITMKAWALATGVPQEWLEMGIVTPPTNGGERSQDTEPYPASVIPLLQAQAA